MRNEGEHDPVVVVPGARIFSEPFVDRQPLRLARIADSSSSFCEARKTCCVRCSILLAGSECCVAMLPFFSRFTGGRRTRSDEQGRKGVDTRGELCEWPASRSCCRLRALRCSCRSRSLRRASRKCLSCRYHVSCRFRVDWRNDSMCRSVFVRILFRPRSSEIHSVRESCLSCLFAWINASDNFEELSWASIAAESCRRIHAEFFNRVN